MRSRSLFALCLVVSAGAAVGACAKASGDFDEGGGGDGDSTSKSSASSASVGTGGAGGAGGSTTSAGGAGGAGGGAGGAGGAGGGCAESPCKLVDPQCGCDVDEQCSLDNTLTVGCTAAGNIAQGQQCGVAGNCAPGLLCVQPAEANVSLCERFCDDDSQCTAPGGLCLLTLNDGKGGTLPGVTLCTENCDPATAATCPVAGTGCQIGQESMGQMRFFTLCAAAGAGTQNASCMANKDCAPSFGCFDTGGASNVCLQYCKVNSPVCPGAAQCVPININMVNIVIGGEQYGACL